MYKQDINVYFHNTLQQKIEINSGTNCFAKSQFMDGLFSGSLFLPKKDWIEYKGSDIGTYSDKVTIDGKNIYVFKVSDELINYVYCKYIEHCLNKPLESHSLLLHNLLSETVTKKALHELYSTNNLSNLNVIKSVFHFSYLHLLNNASIAQKTSSTQDSRSKFKVRGLHIDNWEIPQKKISERSLAGNKILINFGMENRYFTYIDISVEQIYKLTNKNNFGEFKKIIIGGTFATPLSEWFLRKYPEHSVKRILLQPGIGLIIPVQNLIHDGDLYEKKLPDMVSMISFAF